MIKIKALTEKDCFKYKDDIFECYSDNKLILDCQNPIRITDSDKAAEFIFGFVKSEDSTVIGIFPESKAFLLGVVIFDNIRGNDKGHLSAEVHIAVSKFLYGKDNYYIYKEILNNSLLTVVHGQIPSYAIPVLQLCKKLGFKKTGYIPECIPYKNSKGELGMRDVYIMTWKRGGETIPDGKI